MPNYGFGSGPFGGAPFGDINWCEVVLWDEMPEGIKDDDRNAGYPYLKFVQSVAPNFEFLRRYIARFETITDPFQIRTDLLIYFANNFGITIDLAEPEAYRRTRAQLAARWNIIKGTANAYTVLCRVHGFEVDIVPLWWNGSSLVETGPTVSNEASLNTVIDDGGENVYTMRLGCPPVEPGTIELEFDDGGPGYTLTDDSLGELVGGTVVSSTIDYGWGYLTLRIDNNTDVYTSSGYASVVGGCSDGGCDRCKTHRIRLRITPGDIALHDELTVSEAFGRLYTKLGVVDGDGVIPVHVELEQLTFSASAFLSIGNRYDIIPADAVATDTGLIWAVP